MRVSSLLTTIPHFWTILRDLPILLLLVLIDSKLRCNWHKNPSMPRRQPNFIGLVDVVQGNLQGKPDQSVKWAWLYDLLAQRTNEEEGDYIIRDFKIKRLEYVNSKNVDGLFDADENGTYPAIPGTLRL